MAESIFELEPNILKALSHPARIQILEYLKDNKLCQCEMAPLLRNVVTQASCLQNLF